MNKTYLFVALFIALLIVQSVSAKSYAVLVAGSNDFYNYRHQSDVAHHYQLLIENGFHQDNIIVMAYGDVAVDSNNPFKNQLYNEPNGKDNYANIKIDYLGDDVTPDAFLHVITGNKTGVNGPVLATTDKDNVYIYFSDHGAQGLIAFPNDELYVKDFHNALDIMYQKKMYNNMFIQIEACESGSMGIGLPSDRRIYMTTASNEDLSSWAYFCPPEDEIQGKRIGTCLADEYSYQIMHYYDTEDLNTKTLDDQFKMLVDAVKKSPVQRFGDLSLGSMKLSEFVTGQRYIPPQERKKNGLYMTRQPPTDSSHHPVRSVNSRDVTLDYLYTQYLDSHNTLSIDQRMSIGQQLITEINNRMIADEKYTSISALVLDTLHLHSNNIKTIDNIPLSSVNAHTYKSPISAIECGECCLAAYKAVRGTVCQFNDYSLKYARTLHNLCTMTSDNNTNIIVKAIRSTCPRI